MNNENMVYKPSPGIQIYFQFGYFPKTNYLCFHVLKLTAKKNAFNKELNVKKYC